MGFPRQEYWSGLPFPPPGDLRNPGIVPMSPALADRFFTTEPPGRPDNIYRSQKYIYMSEKLHMHSPQCFLFMKIK